MSSPRLADGVGQIAIICKDVPRAVAFYRDAVGIPFLFESNGLAFFQCGGVRLMLSRPEQPEFEHASSILYFTTGDIDGATKALEGKGAKIEGAPHLIAKLKDREVWMAFWRDSEANLMAFMQEKPVS